MVEKVNASDCEVDFIYRPESVCYRYYQEKDCFNALIKKAWKVKVWVGNTDYCHLGHMYELDNGKFCFYNNFFKDPKQIEYFDSRVDCEAWIRGRKLYYESPTMMYIAPEKSVDYGRVGRDE